LDDLIVGASYADPSGKPGAGKSHLDQWRYCWLYQIQHKIYPQLNWQKKHPQSNHPLMLCLVRLTAVLLI
jgi:hypothetical protein